MLSSVCRIPPRNIEISPEKPSVRSKKWRHSGRFGSVKGALQPALCATSVGCAKMTINGRTILVVAGGYGAMDSVEILDPQGNNVWTPGMFLKFITVELCLINRIFVE